MKKVLLFDELGYEVHEAEIPEPWPVVLIWGERVFINRILLGLHMKPGYQEVTHHVITDTTDSGIHKV